MSIDRIMKNIQTILNPRDVWRVQLEYGGTYIRPVLKFDPHGLSVAETKRTIKNIIAIVPFSFVLDIVHGYHRGTAIKNMILNETLSTRVKRTYCMVDNPGRSLMLVAERKDYLAEKTPRLAEYLSLWLCHSMAL